MEKNFDISRRVEQLVDHFAEGINTRFAELVGTSEANIRNYKNGKLPKLDFVYGVCDGLGVSYEWLLVGKGEMLKALTRAESSPVAGNDTLQALLEANGRLVEANLKLADTNARLSWELLERKNA